jgi:hypothetical protein
MAIGVSIVFTEVWGKLKEHLHVVECAEDGGITDPRIRIEFLDVPERLARELVAFEMPCVSCERPNHPLRRREGDDWDRLYYAPTCPLTVRMACSRGNAAMLEYERFKGIDLHLPPPAQLSLF